MFHTLALSLNFTEVQQNHYITNTYEKFLSFFPLNCLFIFTYPDSTMFRKENIIKSKNILSILILSTLSFKNTLYSFNILEFFLLIMNRYILLYNPNLFLSIFFFSMSINSSSGYTILDDFGQTITTININKIIPLFEEL